MSRYRRSRMGQVYFFTVVTDHRQPILTTELGRRALRESIHKVRNEFPFEITAIVLLPDHLHAVWTMPRGDADYSTRWRLIKTAFTRIWQQEAGTVANRSHSRRRKGEQAVWQRRFFEHTCRDDEDLKRCVDYTHVNPLKHQLVGRVRDWPWSSFHRYVAAGEYSMEWGSADEWHGDEFRHFE